MAPDPADLAALRLCEQSDCTFAVNNAITDLKDILLAMANHIASMYPASGGQRRLVQEEGLNLMLRSLLWTRM